MQLKEFINYRVEIVHPNDTLQQAAEKMKDLDVGSMPVCEGQHLVGIVTDRDITIRATARGQDPTKTQVRDVMTSDVVYCFETDSVEDAAKTMQKNQIRRLFVLNEEEELVGITSIGELATVSGDHALSGETLEHISQSSEPGPEQHGLEDEDEEETRINEGTDTRVTGILHDRETARTAIEELKMAGFTSDLIGIATGDEAEQESLIRETQASAVPAEIMPSFPELPPSGVLIVVDASSRAAEAVEVLNRHHAVTGGVRVS
jgi:CBS domain-containing protein